MTHTEQTQKFKIELENFHDYWKVIIAQKTKLIDDKYQFEENINKSEMQELVFELNEVREIEEHLEDIRQIFATLF